MTRVHAPRPASRMSRFRADVSLLGFGGVFWTVVTGVTLIGLAFAMFMVVKSEIVIDTGHGTSNAGIVEVNNGGRGPGSLKVEFEVDGQTVTTWVEQPFLGGEDYQVGGRVQVEYAKSDPTTARLAGQHDLVGLLALLGLMGAAGWGVPWLMGVIRPGSRGRHGAR